MLGLRTYRLKTALILMITILVPILILAYNAYSVVTESRIKSQDKLLLDRLSIGASSFDTWFTDRLSRLILISGVESLDAVPLEAGMGERRILSEEAVQTMATASGGRLRTFIYLGHPCFALTDETRGIISIGVENEKTLRYAVMDFPKAVFTERLGKVVFLHPVAQFFAVDGQVILSTAPITDRDVNFWGDEARTFVINGQGKNLRALYFEKSNYANYGVGAIEDYSAYLLNYQTLTNRFWSYTILLAVITLLAVLFIAVRMQLPVKKLRVAVGQIESGNLDAAIDVHPDDDFSGLYTHFNRMVALNREQIEGLMEKRDELKQQNAQMLSLNDQLEEALVRLEDVNQELRRADQKIMMLLDHVVDLIFRVDISGSITYINEAFSRDLGYRDQEQAYRDVFELLQSMPDEGNLLTKERLLTGELRNVIVRFKREDGSLSEAYSMNTQRVFEEGQLTAVQAICRELKNVNLMQDKLNRRNRELEFLREINETLSSTADLPGLLNIIAMKIDHLIGTAICTIRMINETGNLTIKSVSGQFRHLVRRSDIVPEEDPSGRALRERRLIVIREKDHENFQFGEELTSLMPRIKELIFIPLENEGHQMGVISIGLNRHVSESDIQILDNFAYQAAIAIDKASLYDKLKLEYLSTIKALATAVEAKDEYTEGHSIRVSKFACLIADYMGIQDDALDEIEIAGLLHDIGKIGIGDAILTKPGRLTDEEFDQIKRHPDIGFKIVEPIGLSETIVSGILYHHKRMDMSGYPEQIRLEEVPISARIIGVADAFDAMTSNRSYTRKKDIRSAMEELRRCTGTQFCPKVVDAFEKVMLNEPESIQAVVQHA